MKHTGKNNQGMALITVLILAIFVAGMIAVISTRSLWDGKHTQSYVETVRAIEAANAGIELGSVELFGEGATLPDAPGTKWDLIDTPTILPNGTHVDNVKVSQSAGGTYIIESVGTSQGLGKTAVVGGAFEGGTFSGFGYAVLANNINCIMCHATFDSVDRINNTDDTKYGTFDRIKIASLESLLVRVGSADSHLAGSYYTRGVITDKGGSPLSDLVGSGVNGREFNSNGLLIEDAFGDLNPHDLAIGNRDIDTGYYDPNQYLYTDYPTNPEEQTDGILPSVFPPIIEDGNNNKIVDGTELASLIAYNESTPSNKKGSGITGGVAYGVAPGDTYSAAGLPTSSNGASNSLQANSEYNGNMFLIGTEANPIILDGSVYIDGDIMIKGPVQGKGGIYATGNMYFLGDTTYNDAPGEFGVNATGGENLVVYGAGGNIQIGDYLSPKESETTVTTTDKKGKTKTKTEKTSYNVMSPEALTNATIDPGGPYLSGENSSFTMSEVTLFNRMEYQKYQADNTYQPRFYQLRDDAPVFWFDNDDKEHGNKYDENFALVPQSVIDASGAAILSLAPKAAEDGNPWVSELFLKKAWQDDELSRDVGGQPFQIDGLLYTNNAIFALARSNGKHNSRTYGQLRIRGGMVAADLGILSAGDKNLNSTQEDLFGLSEDGQGIGFYMQYDPRVASTNVKDDSNPEFKRKVRIYLSI